MNEQPQKEETEMEDSKVNGCLGFCFGALFGVPLSGLAVYLWHRFWPSSVDDFEVFHYIFAAPIGIVVGGVVGYLMLVNASLK